jgi:hypothetical protein
MLALRAGSRAARSSRRDSRRLNGSAGRITGSATALSSVVSFPPCDVRSGRARPHFLSALRLASSQDKQYE